jgi:tetratricopeptide (TPR) repeat protein
MKPDPTMRQVRALVCVLGVAAGGLLTAVPALAVRHQMDSREVERFEQVSHETAELFAQGEALLARAQLRQAEEAFAKVRTAVPDSPLAARRHCQVLTELGEHEQAKGACEAARRNSHTVMEARAAVGAFMTGSKPPTVEELAGAIRLAQLAKRLPEQPFGDAAMCEIAYRIGDPGMLKKCVEDLQLIAPNHYETRRWSATLHATPSWPYWLGWGVLGLSSIGTVLHALLRRGRGSARFAAAGSVLVAVAVSTLASPAQAQDASAAAAPSAAASIERIPVDKAPADRKDTHWQLSEKFAINPDDPLSSVPSEADKNSAPMQFGYYIQDLSSEAAYAERKGDNAKAAKLWAALAKAVPDVAVGYRRACRAYEAAGEPDKALAHCSSAINLPGAILDDYMGYSKLMLAKPKLEPTDIADLDAVADHLRKAEAQPDSSNVAERITCQLGVLLSDAKRLERCTEALNKSAKGEVNTLLFGWNLAMLRADYGKARSLLHELKKTSFPPAALRKAEEATADASAWWRRPLQDWRYAAGLGVLALGLLLLALFRRSRNKPTGPATPPSVGSAAAAG